MQNKPQVTRFRYIVVLCSFILFPSFFFFVSLSLFCLLYLVLLPSFLCCFLLLFLLLFCRLSHNFVVFFFFPFPLCFPFFFLVSSLDADCCTGAFEVWRRLLVSCSSSPERPTKTSCLSRETRPSFLVQSGIRRNRLWQV